MRSRPSRRFTRVRLDLNLDTVATGNLTEQCFLLVRWAESHGRLRALLDGAVAENPTNLTLDAFARSVDAVRAGSASPDSPLPSNTPPPGSVPESVAKAEAQVRALLRERPRVLSAFASQGYGADPDAVTQALLHQRTAHEVTRTLNRTLTTPTGPAPLDADDRDALRRLFNECLRFAIDWRVVVTSGRALLRSGANALDLPTRRESVVELLLAGMQDHHPVFDLTLPGAAVGLTQVKLPPILRRAVALTEQNYLTAMVKHIAGTVFASNSDLERARANPQLPAAVADIEGILRALGYEGAGTQDRPYYVILDDDEPQLWQVACSVQKSALPSLQLVRWTGAANSQEAALVEHIKKFLHSTKRP